VARQDPCVGGQVRLPVGDRRLPADGHEISRWADSQVLGVAVHECPDFGDEVAGTFQTPATSEDMSWPKPLRGSWRFSAPTT
jgi:hypothetical protein